MGVTQTSDSLNGGGTFYTESPKKINYEEIAQKYINKPHEKEAQTQAYSCFAETREIDFTKSQTRDEVSFYKKLARFDKANILKMDLKEYEKLLLM